MRSTLPTRLLTGLAVVGLAATAGSAYTAGNTVATSRAGTGTGAIAGYAVSGVAYTFGDSTSAGITYTTVAFTLDGVATKARARINSTGTPGTFVDCALVDASTVDWSCTLPSGGAAVTAEAADELEVVATNAAGTDVAA